MKMEDILLRKRAIRINDVEFFLYDKYSGKPYCVLFLSKKTIIKFEKSK